MTGQSLLLLGRFPPASPVPIFRNPRSRNTRRRSFSLSFDVKLDRHDVKRLKRDGRFKTAPSASLLPFFASSLRRVPDRRTATLLHCGPLFPSLIQSSLPHFNRSLNQATNECATKFSHRDSVHPQEHQSIPAVFRSLLSRTF